MGFNSQEAAKLLADCHRRCCICHRFCGVKMELDHIVPKSEDGLDDIANAIPVCFECHAEIHLYNDMHPRGRKFRPAELRQHKDQWLQFCETQAHQIMDQPVLSDVGPLQSLVDELEFNASVAAVSNDNQPGCPFEVEQFNRAIGEGLISLLNEEVRDALIDCYRNLKRANEHIKRMMGMQHPSQWANTFNENQEILRKAQGPIAVAREKLMAFLTAS